MFGGSTDCEVTVPETLASVCAKVQIIAVPLLGPVFAFESTPVPLQVPARIMGTGGDGAAGNALGGDGATGNSLGGDVAAAAATGGDASPADPPPEEPQETTGSARVVTIMIDRADFIGNPISTLNHCSQE